MDFSAVQSYCGYAFLEETLANLHWPPQPPNTGGIVAYRLCSINQFPKVGC